MFVSGEESIFDLEQVEGIYVRHAERYDHEKKALVDCWRLVARTTTGKEYRLRTYDSKEEALKHLDAIRKELPTVEV